MSSKSNKPAGTKRKRCGRLMMDSGDDLPLTICKVVRRMLKSSQANAECDSFEPKPIEVDRFLRPCDGASIFRVDEQLRIALNGHEASELWGANGLIAATMRCVDAVGKITDLCTTDHETKEAFIDRVRGILGFQNVKVMAAPLAGATVETEVES